MAPERFTTAPLDARADIYSLACLLYECLTAQRPFPGHDLPSLMYAHFYTEPEPPSRHASDLPGGLDEVVLRGMAKNPDDRYATAGELAAAAHAALGGRALLAASWTPPKPSLAKTAGAPAAGAAAVTTTGPTTGALAGAAGAVGAVGAAEAAAAAAARTGRSPTGVRQRRRPPTAPGRRTPRRPPWSTSRTTRRPGPVPGRRRRRRRVGWASSSPAAPTAPSTRSHGGKRLQRGDRGTGCCRSSAGSPGRTGPGHGPADAGPAVTDVVARRPARPRTRPRTRLRTRSTAAGPGPGHPPGQPRYPDDHQQGYRGGQQPPAGGHPPVPAPRRRRRGTLALVIVAACLVVALVAAGAWYILDPLGRDGGGAPAAAGTSAAASAASAAPEQSPTQSAPPAASVAMPTVGDTIPVGLTPRATWRWRPTAASPTSPTATPGGHRAGHDDQQGHRDHPDPAGPAAVRVASRPRGDRAYISIYHKTGDTPNDTESSSSTPRRTTSPPTSRSGQQALRLGDHPRRASCSTCPATTRPARHHRHEPRSTVVEEPGGAQPALGGVQQGRQVLYTANHESGVVTVIDAADDTSTTKRSRSGQGPPQHRRLPRREAASRWSTTTATRSR